MARTRRATVLKWKKCLEVLSKETTFLNHYSDVREQFNLIAGQSPVSKESSEFWGFVHRAFAHDLMIRILRLSEKQWADRKRHVYSLRALLDDMLHHPHLLSREQYLEVTPPTLEEFLRKFPNRFNDPFMFNRLNGEFDRLAGKGASHLAKVEIEKDISDLETITKRLKAYRDKKLAHNSVRRGRYANPKFSEVTKAVRVIHKLVFKYYLLVKCSGHPLNFENLDITEIFLKPWIENDSARRAILDKFKVELEKRRVYLDRLRPRSEFAMQVAAFQRSRRRR